jgi:putative oxidoreductase
MQFLDAHRDRLLSVLRIMSGLLFLQHGTTKYPHFPATKKSGVAPMTMSGAAGLIELVGGVLIVLGLFTRPVAFILSGTMAVVYFYAHAPRAFSRSSKAASWRSCTASCSCSSPPPAAAHGASTTCVRAPSSRQRKPATSAALKASGASYMTQWPALSMRVKRAFGSRARRIASISAKFSMA